jgi:hypothetical protein
VRPRKRSEHIFAMIFYCPMCSWDSGSSNVEYPLEVDDDFWENDDPQLAFRQPPDKPSTIAVFNLWLRLTDFTASALHSFVSYIFPVIISRLHSHGRRILSSTMVLLLVCAWRIF